MVIYGILRYLYLIHIKNLGDNPSDVLLKDFPLQLNLFIWVMVIVAVIHIQGTGLI
jgi:hypothetical protein